MVNLFRAEWMKIAGNRWVAGCLIWIFPVLGVAFVLVMAAILGLSDTAREQFIADTEHLWTAQAVGTWDIPNNPVGRLILLGFTAVVFAGEYQWSTWKNTVPRNRRLALILVKFVALGVYVVLAFVLMSIIITLGMGLLVELAGGHYGPAITGDVLIDFAGDYGLQASLAFTSTIIAAGYAAVAGMITRSILGGVLVGFIGTFVENLSILGLVLVGYLLGLSDLVHLYRLTPGYNLLNVSSWITDDKALGMKIEVGSVTVNAADSLEFSLALLAVWVVGLIVVTAVMFQRQDITS